MNNYYPSWYHGITTIISPGANLGPQQQTRHENVECPDGLFHDFHGRNKKCVCFEDNAVYFHNVVKHDGDTHQSSRLACQQSCKEHPECKFWSFEKLSANKKEGLCVLRTKRANIKYNWPKFVSGAKNCQLPEWQGR